MKKTMMCVCLLVAMFVGVVNAAENLLTVSTSVSPVPVQINKPVNLQILVAKTAHVFRCTVPKNQPDEELYWILDGEICFGKGRVIYTSLPLGEHTVTIIAKDPSSNIVSNASVVVYVLPSKKEKINPPITSTPKIQYTFSPGYGSIQNLKGKILGIDPIMLKNYCVATYIKVPPFGWYNKPFWNKPVVNINNKGSFSCDITTDKNDKFAQEIYSCLIPKGVTPPIANRLSYLPDIPGLVAETRITRVFEMDLTSLPEKRFVWGKVEFTYVPKISSYENLKGKVIGSNKNKLAVVAYIQVYGGWWVKPYWASSVTYLKSNGAFEVDVTTGGYDSQASSIVVFIVPIDYTIEQANSKELLNHLGDSDYPQLRVFR